MDVVARLEPHPQPAELMEPTDRPLDHPAIHTQAAAVGRTPLGQLRVDPPVAQLLPLPLIVEAAVAHGAVRAVAGVSRPAGDRGDGIDQGYGQVGVGRVRRYRIDDQGDALAVGDDRVLAPRPRAVHGAGAGLLAPADGPDMAGVDHEPTEVDLVGATEAGQEDLLDPIPDAGGLPIAQPVPTGHAATAAHLLRQVLPGEAGLED